MSAKNKERFTSSFEEPFDLTLLLLAFLIGAGAIVILKLLKAPSILPVFIIALVLVSYAAFANFDKRSKIEPETIGDNCYYLGFLFTLTSLSVVLINLAGAGEKGMQIEVISGFGVALSSTIFGVLLRVIFMQTRHDLVARERETRKQILLATQDFRSQLSQSIVEMKAFSTETTQLTGEVAKKIFQSAEEVAEQSITRSGETAKLVEHLTNQVSTAAQEAASAQIALARDTSKEISKALRGNFEDLSVAIEKGVEKAVMTATERSLTVTTEKVEEQFSALTEQNLQFMEQLRDVEKSIFEHAKEIDTVFGDLHGTLEKFKVSAIELGQALSNDIEPLQEKASTSLNAISKSADAARQSIEHLANAESHRKAGLGLMAKIKRSIRSGVS